MSPTEKPECASHSLLRKQDRYIDESIHRAACYGNADWQIEGKHYCLMHAPTKDKSEEFEQALKVKLAAKDYNFRGAWFPKEVQFGEYAFENDVNFDYAVFNDETNFVKARFAKNVSFGHARFDSYYVSFDDCVFEGYTYFKAARFQQLVSFNFARFDEGGNFMHIEVGLEAFFNNTTFQYNAYFSGAIFNGIATFNSAIFKGNARFEAVFKDDADFGTARFDEKATFDSACFSKVVQFYDAHFGKPASFQETCFSERTNFRNAIFEKQVFFDKTIFKAAAFADFSLARFMDFVRFTDLKIENDAELYFGEATFEKPDGVHFHSIPNLHPRWFINLDSRKFNFENAYFAGLKGVNSTANELRESLVLLNRVEKYKLNPKKIESKNLNILLSVACRRLAVNAEENNRYREAMRLRYIAMELHRQKKMWRRYLPITLHWWYWASSSYGERAARASLMLFLIWLLPLLFYLTPYAVFSHETSPTEIIAEMKEAIRTANALDPAGSAPPVKPGNGLQSVDAAFYSLNVMAFQKPEPKPADESPLTRTVVILQTLLGPVQATLLLLAIRRKFMR